MAINFGIALHDIYIAKKIYEVSKEMDIGTWLPLTWQQNILRKGNCKRSKYIG